MVDIGSSIIGSLNQANLASRRTEAEKARARKAEDDRVRDARKRFIITQEEVAQAQTLRGSRVEPDKEDTHGRAARDIYEAHDTLAGQPALKHDKASEAADAAETNQKPLLEADSGHLIDIEA